MKHYRTWIRCKFQFYNKDKDSMKHHLTWMRCKFQSRKKSSCDVFHVLFTQGISCDYKFLIRVNRMISNFCNLYHICMRYRTLICANTSHGIFYGIAGNCAVFAYNKRVWMVRHVKIIPVHRFQRSVSVSRWLILRFLDSIRSIYNYELLICYK